jgi:endonuclease/exonuclease/phosphatase family metal-dependent hydrolase
VPPFKVVTINILNDRSRWKERGALLAQGLAELRPDLIALQEVTFFRRGGNTAQWLADQLGDYTVHLCAKTGLLANIEAIAILSRLPVEAHMTLDLRTQNRTAQAVRVSIDGRAVVFANGHYYWRPGESRKRDAQIRLLLDWLSKFPPETAIVTCGDFNGIPESAAIKLMNERFKSAHMVCHACEPEYTCPTPLARRANLFRTFAIYMLGVMANRTFKPWHGTLDYIFVNERVRVLNCEVVLNQPAPHDARLYPSDHFGLAATFQLI